MRDPIPKHMAEVTQRLAIDCRCVDWNMARAV